MSTIRLFSISLLLMVMITACQTQSVSTPTSIPVTSTPLPSDTPEPTLAPLPTNTPEGLIFRDDFTGGIQSGWTWGDENPLRWEITNDGWLKIRGEDASLLLDGFQSNLLCRDAPSGDFQVTVHLDANPTRDFQQATLYLYKDGTHFIAINRGYCGPCLSGGSGVFMDYKLSGGSGTFKHIFTETDLYLRLVIEENTATSYYAIKTDDWQRLGGEGSFFENPRICLGVSNVDKGKFNADLIGRFDYIDISLP
jgi:hypothetical protein